MTDLDQSRARIAEAGSRLGGSVERLLAAIDESKEQIETVSTEALREITDLQHKRKLGPIEAIDIVAFGSMARGEMSKTESDFDYLLVAYGQITNPDQIQTIREAASHAKAALEIPAAGVHTGFGEMVSALDLVNLIGLEADTNRNHTARILLLEESMSLLNPPGHRSLVEALLSRYLYDYLHGPGSEAAPKRGVPRFLLNDMVRYWRTVAVDYQSKRWVEIRGEKWGMRYLKLRSTRKLVYVGSLISLLMPRIEYREVSPEYLRRQFDLTPLARLCQLERFVADPNQRKCLTTILALADFFCGKFAESEFRAMANTVDYPNDPAAPAEFREVRERTHDLQSALEGLFRSDAPLAPVDATNGQVSLSYLRDRYLLF